jgi:hypothetical protein
MIAQLTPMPLSGQDMKQGGQTEEFRWNTRYLWVLKLANFIKKPSQKRDSVFTFLKNYLHGEQSFFRS